MITIEQKAHDLAVAITQAITSKNLDSIFEDFSTFDSEFFSKCCGTYQGLYEHFYKKMSN